MSLKLEDFYKAEAARLKRSLHKIASHHRVHSSLMNANWTKVAREMRSIAEESIYYHPDKEKEHEEVIGSTGIDSGTRSAGTGV